MTAVSVVYCNVVMNLDELNISDNRESAVLAIPRKRIANIP